MKNAPSLLRFHFKDADPYCNIILFQLYKYKDQAKSLVIHKCCDLHINTHNGLVSDQQLIKAALVRHC